MIRRKGKFNNFTIERMTNATLDVYAETLGVQVGTPDLGKPFQTVEAEQEEVISVEPIPYQEAV